MNTTILQVPISKVLKSSAVSVAHDYGFSSLQELIRVFLTKLAKKEVVINIKDQPILLSEKAQNRYLELENDFKTGKNVMAVNNVEQLMGKLKK